MDYEHAKAYLDSLDFQGIKLGLSRTKKLLAKLGDPHKNFGIVHVAGTNGKGSTSSMIANILLRAGYGCGLYMSPHLVTFRERVSMNGAMISRKEAARLITKVKDAVERPPVSDATYFEFLTAVAFLGFAENGMDAAVVEVGLGGRFDSTNIVSPEVSVITSIAMDHRAHLGDNLAKIAFEKCGIIKRNRPLVCGARGKQVTAVIADEAAKKKATAYFLGRDFGARRRMPTESEERFDFRSGDMTFRDIATPLAGKQMADNASLAVKTALILRERGFKIDDIAIRDGLAGVKCAGRFEIVRNAPMVILDGAHNPKAAMALRRTLVERFGPRRVDFVFGAMRDKDFRRMIKYLRPAAKSFSFYTPDMPRAASVSDFVVAQRDATIPTSALANAGEVTNMINTAPRDAVICVTGSFYTVGEISAALASV